MFLASDCKGDTGLGYPSRVPRAYQMPKCDSRLLTYWKIYISVAPSFPYQVFEVCLE